MPVTRTNPAVRSPNSAWKLTRVRGSALAVWNSAATSGSRSVGTNDDSTANVGLTYGVVNSQLFVHDVVATVTTSAATTNPPKAAGGTVPETPRTTSDAAAVVRLATPTRYGTADVSARARSGYNSGSAR